MTTALQQQHELLLAETKSCEDFIRPHVNDDGSYKDTLTQEVAEEFQSRQAKMAEVGKTYDRLRGVDDGIKSLHRRRGELATPYDPAPYPGTDGAALTLNGRGEIKSLGRIVTERPEWKRFDFSSGGFLQIDIPDFDVKALLSTSAGIPPRIVRGPEVVPYEVRRPVIADLMPQSMADQPQDPYLRQTVFTNAAAVVGEGDLKPESALEWEEVVATLRKIATWVAVTDEQLEDVDEAQAVIENQLSVMLALAEEDELLNGDNTGNHLDGFLSVTGLQIQAHGGVQPTPDAILRAMNKVRGSAGLGYAEPSGVVMHPDNWTDMRLLRADADGPYLWGPPSEPGPERVWGKTIIPTTAITKGTALTGDFMTWARIKRKRGVVIKAGYVNDQLIRNRQTIVAETRVMLKIYRPAAFCKITGIPAAA